MKILVASDSFKGTLTSYEVGNIVKEVLKNHHDVDVLSISDGGEGIIESLEKNLSGVRKYLNIKSPIGKNIMGYYFLSSDSKTAIIESAIGCGISLLNENELNPYKTSTYGVGELIRDAISNGAKHILVGIGGTSTNDGGSGMLEAMGVVFSDKEGNKITELNGGKLELVDSFNSVKFEELVSDIYFDVACDVDNILLGTDGATFTFAPQKGASNECCNILENGMLNFVNVVEKHSISEIRNIPGSGAAGGLGMCFLGFFNATLKKGIDLVLDTVDFNSYLDDCDLVVTGEGKMDFQTERGKVPLGVVNYTSKKNIKTIAICGVKELNFNNNCTYSKVFSIVPNITSAENSLLRPNEYLNFFKVDFEYFNSFNLS